MKPGPLLLIILDGWGVSKTSKANAIGLGQTPRWDKIFKEYPATHLCASAEAVGLPAKTIGNSEVGHMNIGAGRIVYQDLTRIHQAIEDKSFFENRVLLECAKEIKKKESALHLMGLLSDGGVHAHIDHLFALLAFASAKGLKKVFLHCFMDGRDTPPNGGREYIARLEKKIREAGVGTIATVMGRYYAMDRDQRWERTAIAYHALVNGEGEKFVSAGEAIQKAYAQGKGDEFILPAVLEKEGGVIGRLADGDSLLFFNFRADRARQLTRALNETDFPFFERGSVPRFGFYVTMTRYEKSFLYPAVFPPQNLNNVFGEVIAQKGLKQFRIAETEKYAHVTYFFNGGKEVEFPGEERCLVPSPRDVPTYDLKPEMSASKVTEEILKRLEAQKYDVMIINYANPDMVGHSGNLKATIQAVETVDDCLGRVLDKLKQVRGRAIITSDHGNAEYMADEEGNPHTAHTLNEVPLVLFDPSNRERKLREGGKLCDIAPTLLELLGIKKPSEMTGQSLLS